MFKNSFAFSGLIFTLIGCSGGGYASNEGEEDVGSTAQSLVSGSTCDPANALNIVKKLERAMLDTIAYTEGTSTQSRGTKNGYNVMVGSNNFFSSCDRHPNICNSFGNDCSTAAGRYQFLRDTWGSLGYSTFWPENQDRGAVKLMRDRGVTLPDHVLSRAEFEDVMDRLGRVWASLPGSPYGQHTYSMDATRKKYCEFAPCGTPTVVVPPATNVPDGTFLRDKTTGEVFVAAGGAPLYVATPGLVTSPAFEVDSAYIAKMNAVPRDGTVISGSSEAYVVVGGAPVYITNWANIGGAPSGGAIRVDDAAIASAGAASGRYSHLRRVPADGTFVQDGVTNEAYVIVGGAPVYITAWANVGGAPTVALAKVDGAAIKSAGATSGRYSHLNVVPADGSYIQDGSSGETYVTVGGAPIYIGAWANVGGKPAGAAVVKVDGFSIASAGATTGRFSHLNRVPADGAYLQDGVNGETYVTVGGAPLYISSWANVGGKAASAMVVKVDGTAIAAAGAASGRYSHLNQVPADGSFFEDGLNHEAYVVAGGAPLYITSWSNVTPPAEPLPKVDGNAIVAAGASSGRYSHLKQVPANGTFVSSKDGTFYRIEGGAPIYVSTWSAFTDEDKAFPKTVIDGQAIANAGGAEARFKHLSQYPADGTQLLGSTGKKYLVQDGKAVPYLGTDVFPGTARVDQYAIDNAGGEGPLVHLK